MTWYFYEVGDDYGHRPPEMSKVHRSGTLKNALARAYQMVKYKYVEEVYVTDKASQTGGGFTRYKVPYIVYDNSPRNRPLSLFVVRTKNGTKRLMADGTMRELK